MKRKKGFTLIELIIIIAVLGILMGILFPTFSSLIKKSKESARIQTLTTIRKELLFSESYFETVEDMEGVVFKIDNSYYIQENGEIQSFEVIEERRLNPYIFDVYKCPENVRVYLFYDMTSDPVEAGIQDDNGKFTKWENIGDKIKIFNNDTLGDGSIPAIESNIRKIVIPSSITKIENNAFKNCKNLMYLRIEGDLSAISKYAFDGCSPLLFNKYENGKYLGSIDNDYKILCGAIKNFDIITINDNCEIITDSAFDENKDIKVVKFENKQESKLKVVGYYAFRECINLKVLQLEGNLKEVGNNAFDNCNEEIFNKYNSGLYVGSENNPYKILCGSSDYSSETLVINSNCEIISSSAFENNQKLKTVKFDKIESSKLKVIGNEVFYNCVNLSKVILPNNLEILGYSVFGNCVSLSEINLPDTINSIGINLFYNCESLRSISVPKQIKNIPNGCFNGCLLLSNIQFLADIESIGNYAFYNCQSLQNISIGENIKEIGYRAFMYCKNILKIVMPKDINVNSIGKDAFLNCDKLEIFYMGLNELNVKNLGIDEDKVFYYSEYKPQNDGNYFHFDDNKNILKW